MRLFGGTGAILPFHGCYAMLQYLTLLGKSAFWFRGFRAVLRACFLADQTQIRKAGFTLEGASIPRPLLGQ